MGQPVNLAKFKKQRTKQKAQGNTLCKRGFHKWVFDEAKQFDVKQGKLVSVERCSRCRVARNHIA